MDLRRLSLDTTPPVDWEPATLPRADWDLTALADHFGSDKGRLKHNYTETYERVLGRWMVEDMALLEIGVACGASLKMWSKFFREGKITGVDIRPECAKLCAGYPNINIVIADATKTAVGGPYDVIIDDGSHISAHIVAAMQLHWPLLKPGGVYIVEDLKCTHNEAYVTPIKHTPADRDRSLFMDLVDSLLRAMDYGKAVAAIEFRRELMIVHKST